jgi:RNA polymerase sigma-70 factor (ECF subfamily)
MSPNDANKPLNEIPTFWTVVCQAHDGTPHTVSAAQKQLLERYGKAVQRYLLGALHDPHAADELFQEFALRFLRGDFHRADPERGRFRDFVKGVLSHLIADYHRRRQKQPLPLPAGSLAPDALAQGPDDLDRPFRDSWRDELLSRAWTALAEVESQTGQPFHTVLLFRAQNPDLRSPQMAERLSKRLGKAVTAAGVRQTLHRARDKYADLLVADVLQTLNEPTLPALEQELADLGLLNYCAGALERLARRP